jgi:predicted phage terminase large subunit-like protein
MRDRLLELRAALVDEQRRQCEGSLATYLRNVWPILEPTNTLQYGWANDCICEHLEAVTAGQITRLVINQPPRTLKSTTVSVAWPTWEWTKLPGQRWMFISYADTLSTKHSVDRRTLIESEWYQERWGDRFALAGDQNVKTFFANTRRGHMFATTMLGQSVGMGGLRLVFDDPHNPKGVLSDELRAAALANYQQAFYPRLDDKKTGAIVIVMQRLHQNDLAGHVLAEGGFVHVKIDNPSQRRTTIVFPMSGRRFERAEGDLIDERREGPAEIAQMRKSLGSYGFSGQYLQEPSPPGGTIFKREWWQFYRNLPDQIDEWIISVDATFKDTKDSDQVAIHVYARSGPKKYLVEGPAATTQLGFNDTKTAIVALKARYPRVTRIYIEDKANGPAIIEDLSQKLAGVLPVNPEGGKIARANSVQPDVEAGDVYLPDPFDLAGNPRPGFEWVLEFIEIAAKFPKVAFDDDIDAFTQAIVQMRKGYDALLDVMKEQLASARAQEAANNAPAPSPEPVAERPEPPPPESTAEYARALFGA